MFKKIKDWYQYSILRGEKKVGERGRAFIPKKATKAEPVIDVKARRYIAEEDRWEDIPVNKIHTDWR